ncbi:MAG: tetratricopeptide repeat protein, partial [Gemmatimonadota bacterium]|nr:tetratricopeptide repeat protein [Gemmatimonadota bacterium]
LKRLTGLRESEKPVSSVSYARFLTDGSQAMVYYYLGYYYEKKGDEQQAYRYYRLGSEMPTDLVFPSRLEAYDVLRSAIRKNPADAHAPYYLGNLMFDSQPENAIEQWEKSRQLDGSFSIVHRNLALAYSRTLGKVPEAIASLEAAIECDRDDPRYFLELDQLYETSGEAPKKRLALMQKNQKAVDKDDTLVMRQCILYVQLGEYDKAIDVLENKHFHVWEGGGKIHDVFVDAHLARGQRYHEEHKYTEALAEYVKALEYPVNLEVGRPHDGGRDPQIYYFVGTAHQALGDEEKARSGFGKSVVGIRPADSDLAYYQGLALRKLGKEDRAGRLFEGLTESGTGMLEAGSVTDYFAKFGEKLSREALMAEAHYLRGLGHLGKGKETEAKREFEKALKLNINHIQAGMQLSAM